MAFLSGFCPLVGEAVTEDSAGFLEGRACACPLVGGAHSCPSGRAKNVLFSIKAYFTDFYLFLSKIEHIL